MRWLGEDAIRPWQYRSWVFPTDPDFAQKAGRILDLYEGRWEGWLLHPGDCVISADEKPSIQARQRICETLAPAAGVPRGQRVEHTYKRGGALTYLAAWDVRRGRVFGRCERKARGPRPPAHAAGRPPSTSIGARRLTRNELTTRALRRAAAPLT